MTLRLKQLVALAALHGDLERMAASDRLAEDYAARGRAAKPPGVARVEIPWLGRWWLTPPQRAVVLMLVEARSSRETDVDEQALARAAELPGRKVRDIFAGVEGWERLLERGRRAGTYRLVPPPEDYSIAHGTVETEPEDE